MKPLDELLLKATAGGGMVGPDLCSMGAAEGLESEPRVQPEGYRGRPAGAHRSGSRVSDATNSSEDGDLPTEILPNFLYLGDANHAVSRSCLKLLRITHVVNVTTDADLKADDEGSSDEIKSLHIPVYDHENVHISAFFSAYRCLSSW